MKQEGLTLGEAVELVKLGYPIERAGWNGKGLFVFMQVPASISVERVVPKMQSLPERIKKIFLDRYEDKSWQSGVHGVSFETIEYSNQLALVDTKNNVTGWSPSTSDALATDWKVYKQNIL